MSKRARRFHASEIIARLADSITNPKVLREELQKVVDEKGYSIFISQSHGLQLLALIPEENPLYKKVYDCALAGEDVFLTEEEARALLTLDF